MFMKNLNHNRRQLDKKIIQEGMRDIPNVDGMTDEEYHEMLRKSQEIFLDLEWAQVFDV